MEIINTIGRRKTSIARVYVKPGKGIILINDRELASYFTSEILQITVKQALTLTKADGNYDVTVNVEGGGNKGQAEAIRLGIARALVTINNDNRPSLRKEGLPGALLSGPSAQSLLVQSGRQSGQASHRKESSDERNERLVRQPALLHGGV